MDFWSVFSKSLTIISIMLLDASTTKAANMNIKNVARDLSLLLNH